MTDIINSLKKSLAGTSAKSLSIIAKKGAKKMCTGPWYEPKVPEELKKQNK